MIGWWGLSTIGLEMVMVVSHGARLSKPTCLYAFTNLLFPPPFLFIEAWFISAVLPQSP